MDGANKQSALIAEVTQGTTPSSPSFLLLRDNRITGSPQRPNARSPERRSNRQAYHTYQGLVTYPKGIDLAWHRDAATDVLWESLFASTFAADVLKVASTKRFFTLEEKYEGGATDPYRRLAGCMVDSATINWQLGQPGSLTFALMGLAESTATAIIAGATYANPSPDVDPVTPAEIVVNDLFSISSPSIVALNMTVTNNLRNQNKMGQANPFGLGLGEFDVSGSVQLYFSQLSDYATFVTKQEGLVLDLTVGSSTNNKDRWVMSAVDVFNPNVSDDGNASDHLVTLNFLAKYASGDASAVKLTRNVA